MLRLFTNVAKAAVAVAVTPATVVADVLTLPASAYYDKRPFGKTVLMMKRAAECMDAATRPMEDPDHAHR